MTQQFQSIAGIVLAGGIGRRFGQNKTVNAKIHGTPVGLSAALTMRQVIPTRVVVRPEDQASIDLFTDADFPVIIAENAASGMGNSLAAAVESLEDATACVVALADMPLVRQETICRVCELLCSGNAIVRPKFEGQAGHPVGFDRRYFQALRELDGDRGARDLLLLNLENICFFESNDRGVVFDVDTAADLASASVKVEK